MKRKLFLLSVLSVLMLNCFAQSNVKGIVVADDSLKSPIPFSAVVLGDVADSSKFLHSTITDMSGMYLFSGVEDGDYVLMSQCLGYEKYSERINISGKDVERNITMASSINELGEVEVLGRTIEKQYDRTVYTITADNRKLASNSLDLLKNVPQLKVNQLDKSVSTNSGGAVKILVDGLSASEQEIVAISKNDIARVEYISFPPARYSDYKAVVNIVRKEQTSGFSAGFDCTNALNAKYGDDMVFFSANMGASKLSVQYSYDYENYKDGYCNSLYKYAVAGVGYSRSEDMHIRKFEKVHKLNFNYSAQKADNYAL